MSPSPDLTLVAVRANLPNPTGEARVKREGDILNNRFELIRPVGLGGTSTVYKALDCHKLATGEQDPYVALKILHPSFQLRPDWPMALQEEANKCQRLAHPNIVKVYGVYCDGATVYLTMEYLYGEPLSVQIRSGNFKGMLPEPALRIINEMGKALAHAHSCGLVHCDVKPANVFLTNAGELKLIDFGIARAFQTMDVKATIRSVTKLRPFNALTPAYASPDILEGREADPRDDIYSLACTAYELLTGVHPFNYLPATEARNTGSTLAFREGLTQKQWGALQRALAFDRAKKNTHGRAVPGGVEPKDWPNGAATRNRCGHRRANRWSLERSPLFRQFVKVASPAYRSSGREWPLRGYS